MAILVRSWNLFHGNASPPDRVSHLREMVALATADEPGVLCLQEVPVWGLEHLEEWSGMSAFGAVARNGLRPARLAGWMTRSHNGLLRSAISGQANAILVDRRHEVEDLGAEQINEQGRERRVCQAVRIDGAILVANTHLNGEGKAQVAEFRRARTFAESLAGESDVVVLAGDFNMTDPVAEDYSAPGPGIDHVLVRRGAAGPVAVWPEERRGQNGIVLSDHAPVELLLG